jgi:hypothetical protein
MTQRKLTVETYWTAETRRHHAPKTMLRLKGHWLKEAGFHAHNPATITVRPRCLTITTTGEDTMEQQPPTLADLLAAVRAAVAAQLHAHPEGIDPNALATTLAVTIAPTDPQALLTLAALDDPELGERHGWQQPHDDAAAIIKANLIDRLWEEAAHAILD